MRIALIAVLMLAACDPSEPALDGAPKNDPAPELEGATPGPAEPPPPPLASAPAAPGTILPGVIGVMKPSGMEMIEDCQSIIAPDYDNPPKMVCLVYSDAKTPQHPFPPFLEAMKAAGWSHIRTQNTLLYFERPKPTGDCADTAAVSIVEDGRTQLAAQAAKQAGRPVTLPTHEAWYAYAIPDSTLEACGADRMKP